MFKFIIGNFLLLAVILTTVGGLSFENTENSKFREDVLLKHNWIFAEAVPLSNETALNTTPTESPAVASGESEVLPKAEARGTAGFGGRGCGLGGCQRPWVGWTDSFGTWSGECNAIFCSPTVLLLTLVMVGPIMLITTMACFYGYYYCLWKCNCSCGGEKAKKVKEVTKV